MADLLTLQRAIHQNAVAHGFWEDADNANLPTKLMLIVSELSEALEEFRHGEMDVYYTIPPMVFGDESKTYISPTSPNAKPEGFGIELADALIRILDLAGFLGLDMGALVELKMAYNETRPYKHGGRRV